MNCFSRAGARAGHAGKSNMIMVFQRERIGPQAREQGANGMGELPGRRRTPPVREVLQKVFHLFRNR